MHFSFSIIEHPAKSFHHDDFLLHIRHGKLCNLLSLYVILVCFLRSFLLAHVECGQKIDVMIHCHLLKVYFFHKKSSNQVNFGAFSKAADGHHRCQCQAGTNACAVARYESGKDYKTPFFARLGYRNCIAECITSVSNNI